MMDVMMDVIWLFIAALLLNVGALLAGVWLGLLWLRVRRRR